MNHEVGQHHRRKVIEDEIDRSENELFFSGEHITQNKDESADREEKCHQDMKDHESFVAAEIWVVFQRFINLDDGDDEDQ